MLRDDLTELDALVAALGDTSRVQRAQASLSDLLRSASGATTLPLLLDRLLGVASRSAAVGYSSREGSQHEARGAPPPGL